MRNRNDIPPQKSVKDLSRMLGREVRYIPNVYALTPRDTEKAEGKPAAPSVEYENKKTGPYLRSPVRRTAKDEWAITMTSTPVF